MQMKCMGQLAGHGGSMRNYFASPVQNPHLIGKSEDGPLWPIPKMVLGDSEIVPVRDLDRGGSQNEANLEINIHSQI